MKKPRLLEKLSPAGRLRQRMNEIERQVEQKLLTRMRAGDCIQAEIVRPLAEPRSLEARTLLFEAQLLRARLYHDSDAATPLEAAEALESAHQHHLALPDDPVRARSLLEPAARIGAALVGVGSRRTRFRVSMMLLQAAASGGGDDTLVGHALEEAPEILEQVLATGEDLGMGIFLASAASLLAGPWQQLVAVRRSLFDLALHQGFGRHALSLWREADARSREELLQLAALVPGEGPPDRDVEQLLGHLLDLHPDAADELEPAAAALVRVTAGDEPGVRHARSRMAAYLAPYYDHRPWLHATRGLAELWEGRAEEALGAMARAYDRRWRPCEEDAWLVAALWARGFRRAARRLVSEAGDSLEQGPCGTLTVLLCRTAEVLVRGDSAACIQRADELARLVDEVPVPAVLLPRVQHLRARLLLAAGDPQRSCGILEVPAGDSATERDMRLDLAEALLGSRREEEAAAVLKEVAQTGPCQRSLTLEACLAESRGDDDQALELLEAAICAPSESEGRAEMLQERLEAVQAAAGEEGRELLALLEDEPSTTGARDAAVAGILERAADVARRLGRPEKELELLLPLGACPGVRRELLLRLAGCLMQAGRDEEARHHLHQVLRNEPEDPEALALSGLLALEEGALERAREHLARACETPDPPPAVTLALAHAQLLGKDLEAARSTLEGGPGSWGPVEPARLRMLAAVRHAQGDLRAARAVCERLVACAGDPEDRLQLGVLSIHLGCAELGAPDREVLLRGGLEHLRGNSSPQAGLLRAAAALALGEEVAGEDLDVLQDSGRTLQLDGLEAYVLRELTRRALNRGEGDRALELAAGLPGPEGEALQRSLEAWLALGALTGLDDLTDEVRLAGVAADLARVPRGPTVALALELVEALGGPPAPELPRQVGDPPPGLRLAAARAHLRSGRNLHRLGILLDGLEESGDPAVAAETLMLRALLEPDRLPAGLEACLDAVPGSASLPLSAADLVALEARAAWLAGKEMEAPVEAGTPVHRRVLAARILEGALPELRPGGDPQRLQQTLEDVWALCPDGSGARRPLTTARHQVQELLETPSLPLLHLRLLEAGGGPLRSGLLEMARALVETGGGLQARHHLALLTHRRALDLEILGDPVAEEAFVEASRAWKAVLEDPATPELLGLPGQEAWERAATRLRAELRAYHQAQACARMDSGEEEVILRHLRLSVLPELAEGDPAGAVDELLVALNRGLDPRRPEHHAGLRQRLGLLLQVVPGHGPARQLLLQTTCESLRRMLQPLLPEEGPPRPPPWVCEAIRERLEQTPGDLPALVDQIEQDAGAAPELREQVAIWRLSAAILVRSEGWGARATEAGIRAARLAEALTDADLRLLARRLGPERRAQPRDALTVEVPLMGGTDEDCVDEDDPEVDVWLWRTPS